MRRDFGLYLDDILDAIHQIRTYLADQNEERKTGTAPYLSEQLFPVWFYGDPPARRCRETLFFIIRSSGLVPGTSMILITPATINVHTVIPAKAGIQDRAGCRIKSGMTTFDMFSCRSNNSGELGEFRGQFISGPFLWRDPQI